MSTEGFAVTCTVIRSAAGAYSGTCGNAEVGDHPIESVAVAGHVVTMVGPTPAGPYRLMLEIAGAMAEGTLVVGEETARIKGSFVAK